MRNIIMGKAISEELVAPIDNKSRLVSELV